MKEKIHYIIILGLALFILAACGSNAALPETVIEDYLTALVEGDNAMAVNLSCAEWEENANAEGASFEGVEVALDSMDCMTLTMGEIGASVACKGNIVFSYAGGEDEIISLGRRNFSLTKEAGEWRMCGYE